MRSWPPRVPWCVRLRPSFIVLFQWNNLPKCFLQGPFPGTLGLFVHVVLVFGVSAGELRPRSFIALQPDSGFCSQDSTT